ncbi:MAG: MMPL family transporter [Thermoleophilia bacterium]|nr:MMPL family transporter [Thermoleophilia bacterium]
MTRATAFVLRHRVAVVLTWALLAGAAAVGSRGLGDLLTNRFSLPGTEAERAEAILREAYGERSDGGFTLVLEGRPARELLPLARTAARRVADAVPTARVGPVRPVAPDAVAVAVPTLLEPADAKRYTDDARAAAAGTAGARVLVTGIPAVAADLDPVLAADLRRGELIAIPIALLILVFVFGTLAFVLPLLFAAAAIPTTLGGVWLLAHRMELSTYVENLVLLIGLGIAVDYSLLVVHRYREERAAGRPPEEALLRTAETAGRAVVFSGTAVAIGLSLMLALPFPFLRGFGVAGLLIPLVSIVAALTLLPALLALAGDRLDAVRLLPRPLVERRERETAFWSRLAATIMRRPVAVAAAAGALLLALAAPVLRLELTPGSNRGIPQALESVQGIDVLARTLGEGAVSPSEVLVDAGSPGGVRRPSVVAATARLVRLLRADREVAAVAVVGAAGDGRYLRLQVVGRSEYGVPASRAFVERLREEMIPAARFPAGTAVLAGGGPPSGVDFVDRTYAAFPWLVLAVLLLSYVLLLRAFRSLVLPLKAILLNLLSVGAAYGALVAFFRWGAGEPLGMIPFAEVEGWIPVFLFAMLFGLSMDYEVFLVSRMREAWDAGAPNERAVALGLARTGRLVTAAGLIMFAAFSGFVAGSIVGLQQFGAGLAVAILVDVTIVRALLVPSAMKLFGRWNWWLPARVARVVRVAPSPLAPGAAPGR